MTTQAQNSGLFRTDAYISIDRGSVLRWRLNSDRLVDSLRMVYGFAYVADIGDSLDLAFTLSTGRKLHPALVAANGAADGYVLTLASGLATWAVAGGGAWDPDTMDVRLTVGPTKLTESLINPGAAGALLMTNGTTTFWQVNPSLPSGRSIFMYSTSITSNNAADTASDKHIFYISQLSREYPLANAATGYYSFEASFYIRDGVNYGSYSTAITYTGGHSVTSFVDGDKIILRFFPGGGATDKYVKLYRIPAGYHVMGAGAATDIYGEYVGHWIIPGANFPAAGTVNIDCTLSYKAE